MTVHINQEQPDWLADPDEADEAHEAVLTIDGFEVLRGMVTGLRLHREQQQCANPSCMNHCLPEHFVVASLREAPPTEPGASQL